MQALSSYEKAAKLQSTAEFKQKIASLKKQIQKGSTAGGRQSAEKENNAKPASNFAFSNGRSSSGSAESKPKSSTVAAAPSVGEIRNDDDYAEAKKSMVSLQNYLVQMQYAVLRTFALNFQLDCRDQVTLYQSLLIGYKSSGKT